jgi:membrane protease YdiL (CAAX protease family)
MILKNEQGHVRLVWRLLTLVAPFFLTAYLLRFIPIRIQTAILVRRGLPESGALSQARDMFLEDPIGMSIIGILQGLLWYGLVCMLVRSIEKRSCSWESFGLSRHGKRWVLVVPGVLLGLITYLTYFAVGSVFGQPPFAWSPTRLTILPIVLVSLDMLANGYGEETAFRAYWQRLLIDRHGLFAGILLASASFVLLHLLIARFTVIALLAGILLACLLGILYVWTGSIFLVGAMHATLNLAPRLLGPWPSDSSLLIVHGLFLTIAIILYRRVLRTARA